MASSSRRNRSDSSNSSSIWKLFIAMIVIFVAISSAMNFLHSQYSSDEFLATSKRFLDQFSERTSSALSPSFRRPAAASDPHSSSSRSSSSSSVESSALLRHQLGGLSCDRFGGPEKSVIEHEMVYWSDIPSDYTYESPFKTANHGVEKFLTFEPDQGGWNNIRMAMETVLVMAHAMGRTLVLPPEQHMYLLNDVKRRKSDFTFKDFFHLDTLHDEHDGIKIITMEEFLTKHSTDLRVPDGSNRSVPLPNDRVNWDGQYNLQPLWNYLKAVGHTRADWSPDHCVVAFPATTDSDGVQRVNEMIAHILEENGGKIPDPLDFTGKPVAVDAPSIDRLRENLGGDRRDELCIYDTEMHQQILVHFAVDKQTRLLTHFYAFLFFEDWRQDLFYKRLVRDKIRYLDDLMCAAGRIIEAIRNRARQRNVTNVNGEYDAFHIRRGDFQYKVTRLDPQDIYLNSKDQLTEGATVFVATDERKNKRELLQPLSDHYDLVYLEDFQELYKDLGTNYYGMLDQLVLYKSRVFIGTWFSTFSGYINRLRGYYAVKHKFEGYEQGIVKSWYFAPLEKKFEMQEYRAVRKPIYMREFPTAWRDIDQGIEELGQKLM